MMLRVLVIAVWCLVGWTYAAPSTTTSQEFSERTIVHQGQVDIVNILYTAPDLEGKQEKLGDVPAPPYISKIFFTSAEPNEGKFHFKGLFVRKIGSVTKLLDNGRDAASTKSDPGTVYFAASDGIYVYNAKENRADKYGTITDNIIGIAKFNNIDAFYILSEDYVVSKVTEQGTKKVKISEVDKNRQIAIDCDNNLYYTSNSSMYIYGPNGIEKVENLDKNDDRFKRAPTVSSDGVLMIQNKDITVVSPDENKVDKDHPNEILVLEIKPKACLLEAHPVEHYLGYAISRSDAV